MSDPEKTERESENELRLENDIAVHIFSVSAAMVGVCLTVIGIFQIGKLSQIGSIADELLAANAFVFLASCVISYLAMRSKSKLLRYRVERVADSVFLAGLLLMSVICLLVAYELF